MWGARYWGNRYWGPRYWSDGGDVLTTTERDWGARVLVSGDPAGPRPLTTSVGGTRSLTSGGSGKRDLTS